MHLPDVLLVVPLSGDPRTQLMLLGRNIGNINIPAVLTELDTRSRPGRRHCLVFQGTYPIAEGGAGSRAGMRPHLEPQGGPWDAAASWGTERIPFLSCSAFSFSHWRTGEPQTPAAQAVN